jgi:hypothetical protein
MKKLFLLFAASAVAVGASAQTANNSVVRLRENNQETRGLKPQPMSGSAIAKAGKGGALNRGTAVAPRNYNYVDYLGIINPDIFTEAGYRNAPYMWGKNDMLAIYGAAGGGVVADTILLASYGVVLDPSFSGFNDPSAYSGQLAITPARSYKVDSVIVYGFYGRNPAKTTIVDTLRISMTYGNGGSSNIGRYYYTGMMANYGTDTIFTYVPNFDRTRLGLAGAGTSNPAVIYRDIYLTAADSNRTSFAILANMAVPASTTTLGNAVAVAVSFHSGENYTPYDTVFRGSVNRAAPFKYGMMRPTFFNETISDFPTYTRGNYNTGFFQQYPIDPTDLNYYPTWAWSTGRGTGPSDYQFPYIDLILSCTTCSPVNIKNVNNAITIGKVYPNPANNNVTASVTIKETSAVNVTLSNTVGQVIATQNLGQLSANQAKNATFSTSALSNGIYFLTVEANGARTTSRFVIAH